MAFLREVIEGTARRDLKNRIDEILEASEKMGQAYDKLSDFFDSLSDGGQSSRLLDLLTGLHPDIKAGLEETRRSEEKLVEKIQGRHFRSIDRLIRYLDKNH